MTTDPGSIDRVVGRIEGVLEPLVREVGELRVQFSGLREETDRRHVANVTLHNNQQTEMKDFVSRVIGEHRSSSSREIARLSARLEPLEDDFKGRRSRAARKRQAFVSAGAIATVLGGLATFWGSIKAVLVGWLK